MGKYHGCTDKRKGYKKPKGVYKMKEL